MLTEEQYVQQQIAVGRRIHLHDGVWWEQVCPFYCKPAWVYKAVEPGSARPSRARSLLGFSHQTVNDGKANRLLPLMVLDRSGLDGFDLGKLSANLRSKVRRGLRRCEVRPLTVIDSLLERMREINILQAERQEAHFGAETPVHRYTKEADAWRAQIRREFTLEGREWWGAFVEGQLAAYLRTLQVEDTRVIQQTKADPAFYRYYPMDALYFTVLSQAAADPGCRRIINGRPQHESLNHYKEQFFFSAVGIPWFSSSAWFVGAARRALALASQVRCLGRKAGPSPTFSVEGGAKHAAGEPTR